MQPHPRISQASHVWVYVCRTTTHHQFSRTTMWVLCTQSTPRPIWALGSIQWTNTFGCKILKYSIKIIKNTTLKNNLASTTIFRGYLFLFLYHIKIGADNYCWQSGIRGRPIHFFSYRPIPINTIFLSANTDKIPI